MPITHSTTQTKRNIATVRSYSRTELPLDLKDKHTHKYIHDHMYIHTYIHIKCLFEGNRGRQEKKRK
jgi:hypothetical protein